MPRMDPVTFARAGAMTTLNRIGVNNGTTISRGVRAESAKRLRVSVANGVVSERARGRRRATGVGGAVVMAVTGISFGWSGGEPVAGQAQIHVVERRRTGADAAGRELEVGDGRHGLPGRAVVDGHCEGGADREGVVAGQALGAQLR